MRERMDLLGVEPAATVSAGGSCRLLRAADGRWVAINLARRNDLDLLAAWMGHPWDGPAWDAVADAMTEQTADAAVDRAQLLGIPAAVAVAAAPVPRVVTRDGGPPPRGPGLPVDPSAPWAR